MIQITDMTGLASSAVAMIAMAALLPNVARLQRFHFVLLACAIAIVVMIPFGGLPLAAYVRGVSGDLSITSLVFLLMAILRPLCVWSPSGNLHAPSPWAGEGGRYILLSIIALAAFGLYPMALGIGFFDPYRLGYGNPWLLGGLLLVALAACFRQLPVIALVIALAVFAWSIGWYESTNLWDYLIDPLLAIYAISALMKRGIQMQWKRQQ